MKNIENIKLIVLDVDGTLTDGGIYYDSQGGEIKKFDVKDGLAIKIAIASGLSVAVITGRMSPIVQRRVEELHINYLIMGSQQKFLSLMELLKKLSVKTSEVYYIGDDWNDLQCIQEAGLSACPNDAPDEIKEQCDYIATRCGGRGAVRECIEWFIKNKGDWEQTAKKIYYV